MKKFLAVLVALLSTGCASIGAFFQDGTTQQVLTKIAIQQYVLRSVIKDDPARAAKVIRIVDQANETIDGLVGEDSSISSEELKVLLASVVPGDLSTADKQLAEGLIELVSAQFTVRIPEGAQKLPVKEAKALLSWVREAAASVPGVI